LRQLCHLHGESPLPACLPSSRGLDHVAVGPPRHDAVLQLARRSEIARKPDSDCEQNDDNDKAGNRAATIVRFGLSALSRIGHRAVIWVASGTPLLPRPRKLRQTRSGSAG
jgi:hypothetical protein